MVTDVTSIFTQAPKPTLTRHADSTPAVPARPQLASIKGVEIFARGMIRGKERTDKDLRDMVSNFKEFCAGPDAIYRPPVVIGHEEDQSLLKNTGIPKVGHASRVWTADGILCSDFAEMPVSIARLTDARAYDAVSSEIYDRPPDGIPRDRLLRALKNRGFSLPNAKAWAQRGAAIDKAKEDADPEIKRKKPLEYYLDARLRLLLGPALRRIALLGGELPEVKTLADLPLADYNAYSETRKWRPTCLRFLKTHTRLNGITGGSWETFSEVSRMDPHQMRAELQDKHGMDPALATGIPDEHLEKMMEHCRKYSEQAPVATPPAQDPAADLGGDLPPPTPEEQKDPEKMAERALRLSRSTLALAKQANIESFCEAHRDRIPAPMFDETGPFPSIIQRMKKLDASNKTEKFADNGKTISMTPLEFFQEEIKRTWPVIRRGERVSRAKAGSADSEVAKVETHYDSYSEQDARLVGTKENFVETFKARRKNNPDFSAVDYIPALRRA